MSRSLGGSLPPDVAAELARPSRARDQALVLGTTDETQYPRFALLSLAEVAVVDPTRLMLALWAGSHSSANLGRAGAGTLFWVQGGVAYSILLRRAATVPFELGTGQSLLAFGGVIDDVRADQVPYAAIVGAVDFELARPAEVLPRWQDLSDRLAVIAHEWRRLAEVTEE